MFGNYISGEYLVLMKSKRDDTPTTTHRNNLDLIMATTDATAILIHLCDDIWVVHMNT